MKRLLVIPVMLAAVLLLGSCAISSPTTGTTPTTTSSTGTPAASRPACEGLKKVDSALTSLSKAGDNIKIGDVKKLQAQLSLALTVVSQLIPADSPAISTLDQLTTANNKIGESVAGLPDDDTLGQHGPQLQQFRAQVAQAQAAAAQLATKLNCPG